MRALAWGALAAIAGLAGPSVAGAATLTVTNTNDSGPGSLRAAIAQAQSGDTVAVPPGHYVLTSGALVINTALTIQGSGARTTILDGNFQDSVIRETLKNPTPGQAIGEPGPSLTLVDLTITGAQNPGSKGCYFDVFQQVSFCSPRGAVGTVGPLTLRRDAITGNGTATGCGVYAVQAFYGPVVIDHSTIAANTLCGYGTSAIDIRGGSTTITDSTIADNGVQALQWIANPVDGGSPETISFVNDTILDNPGDPGYASLNFGKSNLTAGRVTFLNTALDNFYRNADGFTSSNCNNYDPNIKITSMGGNVSNDPTFNGPGGSCALTAASDRNAVTDFKLGSLADNGGPTDTRLPAADSPLVDAGMNSGCPADDQRGVPRPQGAICDVGSVELQSAPPHPTPPSAQAPSTPPPSPPPPSNAPAPTTPTAPTAPTAPTPKAPTVFVDPAGTVSPLAATLHGRVDPSGSPTTYRFEYGLTQGYGHGSAAAGASVGAGEAPVPVSDSLSGLQPGTTYHYRVVAENAGGTAVGADRSFRTPAACRDRMGPVSRFMSVELADGRIWVTGRTRDRGGCTRNVIDPRDRGGVERVLISFEHQQDGLCLPLRPALSFGAPQSCTLRAYNFTASGRGRWTFARRLRLPPGLYRMFAYAFDLRGNREPYDPRMHNGFFVRVP